MKKVEIGKTYENTASDYRLITPISYNEVSNTYTCKVEEPTEYENVWNTYEAELTAYDITRG